MSTRSLSFFFQTGISRSPVQILSNPLNKHGIFNFVIERRCRWPSFC